jgi:hypothetical protein
MNQESALLEAIMKSNAALVAADSDIRELQSEIRRLQGYLERANWRLCDIPACNCNGYHNWNPTRQEIEAPLRELLSACWAIVYEIDKGFRPEEIKRLLEKAIREAEAP